jgi:hypothetical protein
MSTTLCGTTLFAQRIAFAYNSAPHDGIASVTPFEVYHGTPARNTLASSLADPPILTEGKELALPTQFAEAVALSTTVFTAIAKTHDLYVRTEMATRLNEKGSSRVFQIGDKVKVRVPPTQAQLLETGRRAKHVTAWRGPCTILKRLSSTAYATVDDTTKRRYERVLANILPYRATKAKTNANTSFNEIYSQHFVVGEFLAIRDDPTGLIYVALVQYVSASCIRLHYYGTTSVILAEAVFKPCWHEVAGAEIVLDWECPPPPEPEWHHRQFVDYNGEIELKDVHTVWLPATCNSPRQASYVSAHYVLWLLYTISSLDLIAKGFALFSLILNAVDYISTINLGGCYHGARCMPIHRTLACTQ